jgi:hypothetical protein
MNTKNSRQMMPDKLIKLHAILVHPKPEIRPQFYHLFKFYESNLILTAFILRGIYTNGVLLCKRVC